MQIITRTIVVVYFIDAHMMSPSGLTIMPLLEGSFESNSFNCSHMAATAVSEGAVRFFSILYEKHFMPEVLFQIRTFVFVLMRP